VIDALLWTIERERKRGDHPRHYDFLDGREMVLVTAHRRENHGRGMEDICAAVAELARRHADVAFVLPVHPNPHVQNVVGSRLRRLPNVHLRDPLPYPEFVWLMDRATLILSDSGGVQEEAPSLGKPVVVMREETERSEAVAAGAVVLAGTEIPAIVAQVDRLLTDQAAYRRMQVTENPYGDGHAAERIVELMLRHIPRRAATVGRTAPAGAAAAAGPSSELRPWTGGAAQPNY
jgi:UDP-N-acetylglucosamine 2-epimerase (non-hydrolysing)